MLPIEALQQRIGQSELGQEWINNPLLNQDVWSVEKLGYSEEESKIQGTRNLYFEEFSLPWLKLLTKLTVLASVREKVSLSSVSKRINYLKQFDKFLVSEGYNQPELITDSLLQKFVTTKSRGNRQATIAYVSKLWAEEQWLRLPYTPRKYGRKTPQIETIPEEVLHQIYENFDLFPPPLERLFRLQLVLGCRIGEMLRMPRQCLKKEGGQWFLLK
jgi:integrase